MDILWKRSPVTVREVVNEIGQERTLAYTTVLTIISRLHQKGLIKKTTKGGQHWCEPVVSRQDFLRQAWRSTFRQFFNRFGSEAITAFAQEFGDLEPEERQRLQRLLEQDDQ